MDGVGPKAEILQAQEVDVRDFLEDGGSIPIAYGRDSCTRIQALD